MPNLLEKCAVCQALLDEEDLFCANCGTEAPHGRRTQAQLPTAMATHNFECRGCGASMSYDASARALRCPFCGSDNLDERANVKVLRPRRVVPFAIDQREAIGRMRKWLGNSFWRPGDLARTAEVAHLRQVYVPFWSFAARLYTYWTADTSQTPPGARGNWYPLFGEHRSAYEGVLVGGSSVLTPAETHAICPYDLSAGVPPEQVDLENVVYEQFRVQRKYARPLAHLALEGREREACTSYVPGRCRNMKVNVRIEGLEGEPVLLPVWIVAYRYRDQVYRFLMNGQTGKCTGTAPTSYRKIAAVIGVALAVAAAIVLCAGVAGLISGR